MRARTAASALAALLAAGCVGEPSLLCDGERLAWALEELEIGPELDVRPMEAGIQIDVLVRTSLDPGVPIRIEARDADGELADEGSATIAEDGSAEVQGLSLPVGEVTLEASAHNGCREVRASREVFVFDDGGRPACRLSVAEPTAERELYEVPVLRADADSDPEAADFQAHFTVEAGRADIDVRLLLVDLASGSETSREQRSGDDRAAEFAVTLGQGMQAVRAICTWEELGLPQTSATRTFFVDTVAPACELLAPADRVSAGDDLDGDLQNGVQFDLRGRAAGADTEGEAATFTVQGTEVAGAPLDAAGESSAVGELPDPPPSSQSFSFAAADHAGNRCQASVTYEPN